MSSAGKLWRAGCAVLIALVLGAYASGTPLAGAQDGASEVDQKRDKPVVLCWNKDYPAPVGNGDYQVRVKPSRCAFFKRGEAANFAAVRVQSLDWKRWGGRKAKGVGKNCSPMSGTCARVEVKLTRVVERCGRRAYSKVRFEFAGGTAPDPDFKLYTC